MTPFEFNKIAAQVQLEIFERYFEDLNQQARSFQTDVDYANRLAEIEKKLEYFRRSRFAVYNTTDSNFEIPGDLYRLDTVTYRKLLQYTTGGIPLISTTYSDDYVEVQPVTRHEFNLLRRSTLAGPSSDYPVYLYENNRINVTPSVANSSGQTPIEISYLKKPDDPVWAYTVGSVGQFIFSEPGTTSPTPIPSGGSVNFELDFSERTEVIINILFYAGVVIRDPQIVQVASQKAQQEELNEKS